MVFKVVHYNSLDWTDSYEWVKLDRRITDFEGTKVINAQNILHLFSNIVKE